MRRDHGKAPSESGLRRLIPLLALLPTLVLGACGSGEAPVLPGNIPFTAEGILEFHRGDSLLVRIAIEIADTDSAKIRGLMDRRSLPTRGGMLFTYEQEGDRSFWMRSTPLPLDILFIGDDGRVVNIAKRTTPYSDEQLQSEGPALHVLEVRAGNTDRWGIRPGDATNWRRVSKSEQPAP